MNSDSPVIAGTRVVAEIIGDEPFVTVIMVPTTGTYVEVTLSVPAALGLMTQLSQFVQQVYDGKKT